MATQELTGSEKQVKWAKDIIARHEFGIQRKIEGTLHNEEQKAVFQKRLDWLHQQTSAHKIIEVATNDLWDEIGLEIPDEF